MKAPHDTTKNSRCLFCAGEDPASDVECCKPCATDLMITTGLNHEF